MIEKLNVFSVGTFVNCNEWNTNFRTLNNYADYCEKAVTDAEESVAKSDSDLDLIVSSINTAKNSSFVINHTISQIYPENEYFDTLLANTDQLQIGLPNNFNSTARFILKLNVEFEKETPPFTLLTYTGETHIQDENVDKYEVGTYMLFLCEMNGQCIIKITKAGE